MFQEYPKALYKAGVQLIVDDEHQEADMRESGYLDWHDDQARLNEADDTGEQPPDRDALKAEAITLDIHFAPNIKTEKLAELVAAHKAQ